MKHKHIYTISTLLLLTAVGSKAAAQTGVSLKPRVYLQAALHGLLPAATLMRDDLRTKGLLPTTEPYSTLPNSQYMGNGEMITDPAVLQLTGKNAIVDWVVVELRSPPQRARFAPMVTIPCCPQSMGIFGSVKSTRMGVSDN